MDTQKTHPDLGYTVFPPNIYHNKSLIKSVCEKFIENSSIFLHAYQLFKICSQNKNNQSILDSQRLVFEDVSRSLNTSSQSRHWWLYFFTFKLKYRKFWIHRKPTQIWDTQFSHQIYIITQRWLKAYAKCSLKIRRYFACLSIFHFYLLELYLISFFRVMILSPGISMPTLFNADLLYELLWVQSLW